MKKLKMILTAVLMVVMLILPQTAFADSLGASVTGDTSVNAGEEFHLKVTYSSDYLDSVKAMLEFDSDGMEYVSGGLAADDGEVALQGYSDDGKSVTFDLVFKAKQSGDYTVNLETEEAYDLDGKAYSEKPDSSCNVKVKGSAQAPENEKEDKAQDDNKKPEDEAQTPPENPDDQGSVVTEYDEEDDNGSSKALICGICITAVVLAVLAAVLIVRKKRKS